jgi:hypothetical protein
MAEFLARDDALRRASVEAPESKPDCPTEWNRTDGHQLGDLHVAAADEPVHAVAIRDDVQAPNCEIWQPEFPLPPNYVPVSTVTPASAQPSSSQVLWLG